jgi:hypothetical protein
VTYLLAALLLLALFPFVVWPLFRDGDDQG